MIICRCSIDARTRPLLSNVTGTFSAPGMGLNPDESVLLVDVIALINTIPMRTLSSGATRDAYQAEAYRLASFFAAACARDETAMPVAELAQPLVEIIHRHFQKIAGLLSLRGRSSQRHDRTTSIKTLLNESSAR